MPGRSFKSRNGWWTRDRMIEAGARFYRERGCTPTSDSWWHQETRYTAQTHDGLSGQGSKRPYPSCGSLGNFWKGMRPFWLEVAAAHPELGIFVDRGDAPWSALEEWFVTESVGLIGRAEVSRLMEESGVGRTEPAIKRRLYELGINTYNRWGWTVNHLARVIGVSGAVIEKYIDHGKLPFFQGHKCLYLEPADFFVIQEYDWSKKRHPPELATAVRKSLMQRACYIALGFDWRKFSYHQIQPRREFFTGRIKNPRAAKPASEPRPTHVRVGDWVVITGEWVKQSGAKGRIGQVKNLVWSPLRMSATQKRPARPACWIVTVEFPKLKGPIHTLAFMRVRYNLPASFVKKVRKPYERKRELVPVPPRIKRKARMKIVGTETLSTRLNITT